MLADRAIPIELDGEHASIEAFAALDGVAREARVSFIVEMDHFIAEKRAFRLLVIRYLASRGWTWFGEECDERIGRRLDEYLRGGDETLLEPLVDEPWYTTGVLATTTRRHDDLTMQTDRAELVRAVRRHVPGARWFGFDVGADDTDYLSAANAAMTIEDLPPVMALRERIMHERVAAVLRDNPDAKVALMAGSTHLMKDDDRVQAPGGVGPGDGLERSVGHHVCHELTDAPVLSVWLLHGGGRSSNPWLPPPATLTAAAGTFDAELLARVGKPCFVPVGDDHHRRAVTQMHNLVLHCRFVEQVDAIVFAPAVTPLWT